MLNKDEIISKFLIILCSMQGVKAYNKVRIEALKAFIEFIYDKGASDAKESRPIQVQETKSPAR